MRNKLKWFNQKKGTKFKRAKPLRRPLLVNVHECLYTCVCVLFYGIKFEDRRGKTQRVLTVIFRKGTGNNVYEMRFQLQKDDAIHLANEILRAARSRNVYKEVDLDGYDKAH